jgi:hypothetical protein
MGGLGQVASQGDAMVAVDDWITINKDYSSQRCWRRKRRAPALA